MNKSKRTRRARGCGPNCPTCSHIKQSSARFGARLALAFALQDALGLKTDAFRRAERRCEGWNADDDAFLRLCERMTTKT